ncbi:dTDP-4-dehydrorhamnose reductase [Sulfurihydrogenibium azorense]|uniref:dTDP-4-dehydrorhamnose reductase n=1 Tax=Sulfurihydrogenibium azorense TaxID=309806 RepID=UPI00391D156E
MKYLIFGSKGQLAQEFINFFEKSSIQYKPLSKEELDVRDLDKVVNVVKEYKPDVIINCSAYNQVDRAQSFPEEAFSVNTLGVSNLGITCKEFKIFLVHYSTDYVFDGTKQDFYTEEDLPNPLNKYGESKLLGEFFIKNTLENYLIFRVSWVYGKGKQNFLYKLNQWAAANSMLKIAVDEFSVPTSTRTIVEITLKALKQGLTGLYHLTNSGYASRYEWSKEYLKLKQVDKLIYPAYQSDFNLPAKRPKWSVMSNQKISKILNTDIPLWNEELKLMVREMDI